MKSEFRDWSDIRVFLAVMRAGSTLAASKTLGLSQPTVARRIEVLEHALGIRLFERDTRGFQPTSEALALMAEAEAVEAASSGFVDKARSLVANRSRTIRFTSFQEAFAWRIPKVIEAFIAAHRDVTFQLLPGDAFLDIAAGEADIALRVGADERDPSLICRKVRVTRLSLFASKGYAAKHGLPRSEADFAGHKFIVYDEGRLATRHSSAWLRARIDPDQIAMSSIHMTAAGAAVQIGAGIGILPWSYASSHENVVRAMDLPVEVSMTSWLLVNPAAWRRPEVKAFATFFVPRYRALFEEK